LQYNVAIGAHPSYPDRANFGRVDILDSTLQDLPGLLLGQLDQLQSVCKEFGTRLRHVKPHGALYNRAAKDPAVSAIICDAIVAFDPSLLLYGLSGSKMQRQAETGGLTFISEVFADRTYRADGSLTPRTEPNAMIEDPAIAVAQVIRMVREGIVLTTDAPPRVIPLTAQTVCIHGDGPHAVAFAQTIHDVLQKNGIVLRPPF